MKQERALLGTTATGGMVILATDGTTMAYDCREISHDADDVGLPYECKHGRPMPGLYLFTGTFHPTEDGGVWRGTTRHVHPDEITELFAMTPPPDEDDDREQIQPGDAHLYRPPGAADR